MADEGQKQKGQRNLERKEKTGVLIKRETIRKARQTSKIYWLNLAMQFLGSVPHKLEARLE
jgi:hypothetical protein